MTAQPAAARRASAMNALAHAAEALYGGGRNPVASMAAAAGAGLIAAGLADETPEAAARLALGAVLGAYAMDSAGYSLHHVLCQTIVRLCGTPHAATNAAVLPHVLQTMRPREPEAIAALADALEVTPDALTARVAALAGAGSLADLGVRREQLPAVADAALERPELHAMTPPPDRDELLALLRRASRD